jgi:hypothetical protein
MAEYFILFMYHIFFIHSLVDGYLDQFHSLAIVSSADLNMGVQAYIPLEWYTTLEWYSWIVWFHVGFLR